MKEFDILAKALTSDRDCMVMVADEVVKSSFPEADYFSENEYAGIFFQKKKEEKEQLSLFDEEIEEDEENEKMGNDSLYEIEGNVYKRIYTNKYEKLVWFAERRKNVQR